jgi:hypothetical protein
MKTHFPNFSTSTLSSFSLFVWSVEFWVGAVVLPISRFHRDSYKSRIFALFSIPFVRFVLRQVHPGYAQVVDL